MAGFLARSMMLSGVAFGVLAAVPSMALAQGAAADDDSGVIVVTARRMEEKLQDVPISISVYNQEQLSSRNVVSATDLATYTPSLSLNGRYGPDKSSFAIRGFSQDLNTLPTVGVYFADVVAPRLSSNITSGNGAGPGSMFDLQNVQVLKGPQGTLFGRNTTGGAILIIPQKPTGKLEGYVEASFGNYDAKRIQAVLNVPVSDSLKLRFGVDRNTRKGWLNNRTGVGPADMNDSDYLAARFSILANLSDSLENYTVLTYNRSTTNGQIGKGAYCNRGTVVGSIGNSGTALASRAANCAEIDRQVSTGRGYYDVYNTDPDAHVTARQWQAINTTKWEASDNLTVKNIFAYGESKESYSFNLEGDNIARPFVSTFPGPNRPQGNQWTLSEELQFQGSLNDGKLIWQAGGYLEHSSPIGTQEQYTSILSSCRDAASTWAFACTGGQISVARNNYRFKNHALYAQGSYKFTDKLTMTAGIRYTWDWQRVNADNITYTPALARFTCSRATTPTPNPGAALLTSGACTRSFTTKSAEPTWLIDLEYKPIDDVLVYAKYARGYRGGGLNEANFGFESWQPEFVDSYELGIKTSFRGEVRGTFNLTGFWNKFRDQQVSVFIPQCSSVARASCTTPAPTGINGIQNVGKSELKGIEAEASFNWKQLQLDIGYAYIDAKVTDGGTRVPNCDNARFECSQAVFLTKGLILPFAPKNRISVTGTYTLPVDENIGKISLSATFTHTDSYYSNHGDDLAFSQGVIPFNSSISPATNLVNLAINWKNIAGNPLDLSLYATNVTKQKYWVSNVNGISSTGAQFLILGEPRMYGFRLKYRFGE
jgi:iron complex outermembrane receptor protein